MKEQKKLKVSDLKNGTVIDHIPAKNLFKVIKILGLNVINSQITFGTNLESKKLGKKAIIKISNIFFKDNQINKIILVAPEARINTIKNYKVTEKKQVQVPNVIRGIAKCVNPKCITNHEEMETKFTVISKTDVALKCLYCEKITNEEHIKIIT